MWGAGEEMELDLESGGILGKRRGDLPPIRTKRERGGEGVEYVTKFQAWDVDAFCDGLICS